MYFCTQNVFSTKVHIFMTREEKIRAEIVDAGAYLFDRYGYMKTTMEDIARHIGKGKSTVYNYFVGKDDIFFEVVARDIDKLIDQISDAVAVETTAAGKLKSVAVITITFMSKDMVLRKVIMGEINESIKNAMDRIKERYGDSQKNTVSEIIRYGVDNGEFSDVSEDDINTLGYVFSASLRAMTVDQFMDIDKVGDGFILKAANVFSERFAKSLRG